MKFTRIPETTFQKLQLNAGILLSDFTPGTGTVEEEDILGATSGGVNFVATPEFSDFGEDIDNAPVNVLELKRLDSWEVTMSGTFVTVGPSSSNDLYPLNAKFNKNILSWYQNNEYAQLNEKK